MHDFANFELSDMVSCGAALRGLGAGSGSMEEVAERVVGYFYDALHGGDERRACALVRFYKTHPFKGLPPGLRDFATGVLGGPAPSPEMKCLTLLATTGDEPHWRSRAGSAGHQAIPLPSEEFVSKIPMIRRLVHQFGVEVRSVLEPDESFLVDVEQKTFNVFHVAEAAGSPYIPAQDFVAAHGVRSVLGFGGMLATGDLYAVILFSKVAIPRDTADLFKTIALGVKLAVHPFLHGPVFAERSPA
jgi:hypothetical protein